MLSELQEKLDYVKAFFTQQFAGRFNASHLQTLKQFIDSGNIPLQQICQVTSENLLAFKTNKLSGNEL